MARRSGDRAIPTFVPYVGIYQERLKGTNALLFVNPESMAIGGKPWKALRRCLQDVWRCASGGGDDVQPVVGEAHGIFHLPVDGPAFCSRPKKKSARGRFSQDYELAEEEGFEPSLPGLRVKRVSRPPHSTTLPPLRIRDEAATVFADGHGRSRRFVQRFDHAAFCKPASHSVFMAERRGFEPRIRFWRIHDFQSCSFGQLGHLSASPSCAPSSDEAAAK